MPLRQNQPSARVDFVPADHGLVAWAYDPVSAVNAAITQTAGTLYVVKIKIPQACVASGMLMLMTAVGATLTAGQNFGLLFDETGARVAATADQSTAWAAGLGTKDMALTAPVTLNGPFCYAGFYANGSTLPTFRVSIGSGAANVNLAATASRFAAANTGLTSTPPTTLGTLTAAGFPYWVGLR